MMNLCLTEDVSSVCFQDGTNSQSMQLVDPLNPAFPVLCSQLLQSLYRVNARLKYGIKRR